jgi:hypothetical protein
MVSEHVIKPGKTSLEVVRTSLMVNDPIQSKIAPDMLIAIILHESRIDAARAATRAEATRADTGATRGVTIRNDDDLRRLLHLTKRSTKDSAANIAAFSELVTTTIVIKDPEDPHRKWSTSVFLLTRMPTLRGKSMPMALMLAPRAGARSPPHQEGRGRPTERRRAAE